MTYKTYNSKVIIGLSEKVVIKGNTDSMEVDAKIDTGATKSSIDAKLAEELKLGPVIQTKMVRNAHGHSVRPIINVKIEIAGKDIESEFTVADRKHMKYRVLIGQNLLKENFLIDPSK